MKQNKIKMKTMNMTCGEKNLLASYVSRCVLLILLWCGRLHITYRDEQQRTETFEYLSIKQYHAKFCVCVPTCCTNQIEQNCPLSFLHARRRDNLASFSSIYPSKNTLICATIGKRLINHINNAIDIFRFTDFKSNV